MAVANLGVRVVLEDGASAGLGALGLSMGRLYGVVGLLASGWNSLTPATQALGIVAGASAIVFGGFVSALKDAVDAAAGLQDSMANIEVAVDGANTHMGALQETLISISDNSIYSSQQVADAFVSLGQRGQDAQSIIGGVGQAAIDLAEATRSDTVPAADLLGQTLQLFNMNASQAQSAATDLAFAFEHGIPSVSGLQSAIASVGPYAQNMGISLHDLMPVLSLLAEDMGSGEKAGTSLRYMLQGMSDPVSKAQKEFADLGIVTVNDTVPAFLRLKDAAEASGSAGVKAADNFDGTVGSLSAMFTQAQKINGLHTDETFFQWAIQNGVLNDKLYNSQGQFIGLSNAIQLIGTALDKMPPEEKTAALMQLFNVRSGTGMASLANDIGATSTNLKTLTDILNGYSAEKNAETKTNTLSGAINRLHTNFQNFMAGVGSADLGPLQKVFGGIADILGKAYDGKGITQVGSAILNIGTIASGAVFGITSFAFAYGALKKVGDSAFVSDLGKGFGQLLSPLQKVSDVFRVDLLGALKSLSPHWDEIMKLREINGLPAPEGIEKLSLWLHQVKFEQGGKILDFFKAIPGTIGNGLDAVKGFGAAIKEGYGALADAGATPEILLGNIKNLLAGGIRPLISGALNLIPAIVGIGSAALPVIAIVLLVAGVIATVVLLFTTFRQQGQQIADFLGGIFGPVFQAIGGLIAQAVNQIKQAWEQAHPAIESAMNQLVAGFKAAQPVFQLLAIVLGVVVGTVIVLLASLVKAFISVLAPIIGVFAGILNVLGGFFNVIIGLFTLNGNKIKEGFGQIWTGLLDIIKGFVGGALGFVTSFVANVASTLAGLVKNIPVVGGVANALSGIFGGINNGVQSLFGTDTQNKVAGNVKKTGDTIHGSLQSVKAQVYGDGEQISQALVDGVYANEIQNNYEMQKYGNHLGTSLISGTHTALNIKSPSRVFRDIGNLVAQGLALGVTDGTEGAVKATGTMVGKAVDSAKSALSTQLTAVGRMAFSSPTINSTRAQYTAMQAQVAGGSGDIVVNVPLDNNSVYTAVVDKISGKLKSNGVGRKMHSMKR